MGKVAPTCLHNLSEPNARSLSSMASRSGKGLILPGVKVSCSDLGFWKVPGSNSHLCPKHLCRPLQRPAGRPGGGQRAGHPTLGSRRVGLGTQGLVLDSRFLLSASAGLLAGFSPQSVPWLFWGKQKGDYAVPGPAQGLLQCRAWVS